MAEYMFEFLLYIPFGTYRIFALNFDLYSFYCL